MNIIDLKKGLFLFSALLLVTAAAWSLPLEQKIHGKVVDKNTGEPLPGVNIFIEHTTVGTATDDKGYYRIPKAPVGSFHLTASMMGYQINKEEVSIGPNADITVNFQLKESLIEMGAVVVTGTATPHHYIDTPVRTEIVPRKLIEQKQACNLAEALSFQTGVRVENNCTNCNFSQVRILGLDGKYSQILIDGDPVISSLAGVYGLEHFPEEMVDQIEVVKGGGSSLYGGGAVAGVINMITRRPITNQVRIKYQGNSTDGEMDEHVGAVAETVSREGTSGTYAFGSYRKRNPYDHNGDGFSELGELRNESIGFKWYYQPITGGEFLASLHHIHEERRGGNQFDVPQHEADIAEWLEHWRTGGTVRWSHRPTSLWDYRLYYSFSNTDRKSYFGGLSGDTPEERLEALDFYGKTDNPLQVTGLQTNYRLQGHLLTAGLQYSHDKINDKTAAETAYYLDEIYTNTGVFVQDNLHLGAREQVEFVAGVRVDKHSELSDWVISPRINGKFDVGKGVTLRAAFTTGFKPPQTYDEDLHLCGVEGDQRIIRNSKDLKEERSNTYTAGIEFMDYVYDIPTMIAFTGFYTKLSDSFTETFVAKQGNIERWERVNSDGAEVKGIELEIGIRPFNAFEIRTGMTYKKSEYETPNEDFHTRNFLRTPDFSGDMRLSWPATDHLDLYANGKYLGESDIPHEKAVDYQEDPLLVLERSDAYFEADLGLTCRLPLNHGLNAKINLGIKNVLDAYQDDLDYGADRDPAYIYGPMRPRTIHFGVETSF